MPRVSCSSVNSIKTNRDNIPMFDISLLENTSSLAYYELCFKVPNRSECFIEYLLSATVIVAENGIDQICLNL